MSTRKRYAHRVGGKRKTTRKKTTTRKRHNPRKKVKKWEQKAVKHPGYTEKLLRKLYGEEAFKKDGNIKLTYVNKAIADLREVQEDHGGKLTALMRHDLRALVLARTYIRQANAHKRGKRKKSRKR